MKNYYTEEEKHWCMGGNTGLLPVNITPSHINELKDNEIFVFGSNFRGQHIGGAAKTAAEKFGAIWGCGEGIQGKSYAIPTMEGLNNIKPAVERFTSFAKQHYELHFWVTPIGCGIAGYNVDDIAPLFIDAAILPNVYLPLSFWKAIMKLSISSEEENKIAQQIIDLCKYMHHFNCPQWGPSTDTKIFNSLDRAQMWTIGVRLGVIPPAEHQPQTKELPDEIKDKIRSALVSLR